MLYMLYLILCGAISAVALQEPRWRFAKSIHSAYVAHDTAWGCFSCGPAGAKVAICEMPFALIASETRGGPGGTCVLRGCIPKKMLAIGGEMREMMDAAVEFG